MINAFLIARYLRAAAKQVAAGGATQVGRVIAQLHRGTLALATQALERTHSMKWASLGLDKLEDAQELPELPIIDYSEEQIEEIRRKQREAYQNEGAWAPQEKIEA